MLSNEQTHAAAFFDRAIAELGGFSAREQTTVVDFGCGCGALVAELNALGYRACGCDVAKCWADDAAALSVIETDGGYRLPYPDASADVVLSTSVLEHAQN